MKLYRFMSRQEYKALAMGKTIISSVNHAKRGLKTTAKGICFGVGDYEQAKKDCRYLDGVVIPNYLVVFDRPDTLIFTKCQEQYIDWGEYDKLYSKNPEACPLGAEPRKIYDEYYTSRYSLNDIVETYEVYQVTSSNSLGKFETVRII